MDFVFILTKPFIKKFKLTWYNLNDITKVWHKSHLKYIVLDSFRMKITVPSAIELEMKKIEEKKHLFATYFLWRMLDIHFYILKIMSQNDINWVWKVQYRRSLIFICGSFLKQYWYNFEIKEVINQYFPHKYVLFCICCKENETVYSLHNS